MTIGLAYWILMFLWLFNWGYWSFNGQTSLSWHGNNFLLFVLFVILGWHDFGPPIHG